jgi:hypothetical protein
MPIGLRPIAQGGSCRPVGRHVEKVDQTAEIRLGIAFDTILGTVAECRDSARCREVASAD